eukprot:COSAG06_NODE_6211_length_3048_cov_1.984062_3_plen_198_part_00
MRGGWGRAAMAAELEFSAPGKAWAPVSGERARRPSAAALAAGATQRQQRSPARSPSPVATAQRRGSIGDAEAARRVGADGKRRAPTAEDFDKLLQPVPSYLRHGPVSPVAPLTVLGIALALVAAWPRVEALVPAVGDELVALEGADAAAEGSLRTLHATCCCYSVAVLLHMNKVAGLWPVVRWPPARNPATSQRVPV